MIAIAVAAFGLFAVELLAARLLLPVFGGAAAVWTTSLCFFTAVLFLGYLYAHLVATRLSMRTGGFVHAGLAVLAIGFTFAAPTEVGTLRRPDLMPALNVLLSLTVLVGPAAFVMASTTPLLSAWHSRRGDPPWWLYAASNAASFAALLAYPFVIAPALSLSRQRLLLPIWLIVYGIGLALILARRETEEARPRADREPDETRLSYRRQSIWLLAAAAPAGLLSATTNFIQTDLVAAPLIWIGPLAAYLASFVVAFSERGRRALPLFERLTPAAATLLWVAFVGHHWPAVPLLAIELASLFVVSVAVHGRLAGDRPSGAHLTRFYLILSLGGMLATAFVALVAPIVFSRIYEYPILIAASVIALALLPGPVFSPGVRVLERPGRATAELLWRLAPFALAALLVHSRVQARDADIASELAKLLLVGGGVVALAATAKVDALLAPIVMTALIAFNLKDALVRERTFFGVVEVIASGITRVEYSGTTIHGLQSTDDRRREPTTYFTRVGPLGMIFDDLRGRTMTPSVGVVGLGIGTIAAYAQPGDRFTFYEIDPAVIAIAENPDYFTYLSDAAVAPRVVAGDGRLSLMAEPAASFDLLVLDAFTSDVVPAHLLTREAMQVYARTLRPGGLLAFHVSSHFYNLAYALGATARSLGFSAAAGQIVPSAADMQRIGALTSTWLVVGGADEIARFEPRGWTVLRDQGEVLSDDYSDLTKLLILKRRD